MLPEFCVACSGQIEERSVYGEFLMTALDVVKTFLDGTFPDVGEDCPIFPVMVVLFAAALLQDTSVDTLFEFTGYRKDFIEAISINMTSNELDT